MKNTVTVIAPATSANVGPGFDSAGIAFKMYAELKFSLTGNFLKITGCPKKYANKYNLAYTAFAHALKIAGKSVPEGLCIDMKCDIPMSRGLGSSAAMIVASVTAANELFDCGFDEKKILEISTSLEGHPDNAAPAVFGGLACSFIDGENVTTIKYNVSDALHFTALVPEVKLSTELSRKALPNTVPFRDAVYNVSRTAVLYKAMEDGNIGAVSSALDDRLHQYYRKGLIPDYDAVKSASYKAGAVGFYLSGAGSTLMCVSVDDISEKLKDEIKKVSNYNWRVIPLEIDTCGARVL